MRCLLEMVFYKHCAIWLPRTIVFLYSTRLLRVSRTGPGGAQARYGVQPDLTCLGKIVGGGLPAAAYGGRTDIMDNVSPLGMKISQAGTLSGNPPAMAAGYEQLQVLSEDGTYDRPEAVASRL